MSIHLALVIAVAAVGSLALLVSTLLAGAALVLRMASWFRQPAERHAVAAARDTLPSALLRPATARAS